ncbi:DUF4365 domain-containing protein [Vreelandella sp. 2A-K22]
MANNRTKERIGVNLVQRIVETDWESGWQEYAAQNDDAVDGIILMRKGSKHQADTGGVVFVQVKCGGDGYRQDQKQYPDHLCISLGKGYLEKHLPRWKKVPGPVVLIFVDDTISRKAPPAWWVDLRSDCISPTNQGLVMIPKSQRFGHHAKGDFHSLCGPGPSDRQLMTIKLKREDQVPIQLGRNESLRSDAWEFYKRWREDHEACFHDEFGFIAVNRVGWKHITRIGRSPERIVQSWLLLGAARQMILQNANTAYLGHARVDRLPSGATRIVDYLGLRANVTFPHRHQSVVQVVLKRQRILDTDYGDREKQKVWFYSVYEPRRGMQAA